jgi:hypothetical protein
LGAIGKAINPLNPFNAAAIVLEETIRAVADKTLGPEAADRVGYFSMGPKIGAILNILDAGAVNAKDDRRLIEESNRYFAAQKARSQPVLSGPFPARSQPVLSGPFPASPQPTSFVSSTPVAQASLQAVAPRSEPRSIPVPSTPTPSTEEKNALATEYMKHELLGRSMAEGGELQRRLWEAGGGAGMTADNFMTWVESHPDIAYRELLKRGG